MEEETAQSPRNLNTYWLLVLFASGLEIGWAMLLKAADSLGLWLLAFALIATASLLLIRANEHLPVGTVYAIFTGVSAVGTVLAGIFIFGEAASAIKIALICLLLSGVLGLKLVTDKDKARANQKSSAVKEREE